MRSIEKDPKGNLKLDLRLAGRIARGEVQIRDLNLTRDQVRALQLLRSWHES